MEPRKTTSYYRDAEAVEREEDNEMLILNVRSGAIKVLNESGILIWRALATGPRRLDELVTLLCSEYDVEPAVAEQDVQAFLDAMLQHELIHQAEIANEEGASPE